MTDDKWQMTAWSGVEMSSWLFVRLFG